MKNIKKTFAVKLATMALMAATLAPTCATPVMAATRNQFVKECQMETENDNALAITARRRRNSLFDKNRRGVMETDNGIVLAWNGKR